MGKISMVAGYVLGGVIYLVTAGIFFSNGENFLGLVQLFVPPAVFVLPWLVSPALGIMSLASVALMFVGAALDKD
jgi:hypothetical protein